jgi:hypothetical protein
MLKTDKQNLTAAKSQYKEIRTINAELAQNHLKQQVYQLNKYLNILDNDPKAKQYVRQINSSIKIITSNSNSPAQQTAALQNINNIITTMQNSNNFKPNVIKSLTTMYNETYRAWQKSQKFSTTAMPATGTTAVQTNN